MSYLRSLSLSHFRCYGSVRIDDLLSGLIVLHGANGAGKTNVLEAISLLSPGRGLRNAKVMEIQSCDHGDAWVVAGELATDYGPVKLGTGLDVDSKDGREKRLIRINGQNARGQSALAEHISCIWLTPQMDRLFLDSSSHRRRFLDRLIFSFDPGHSGRVTRYENAMRQRSRILQDAQGDLGDDVAWVEGLEAQMAETGCAIAAARLDFVGRLQAACEQVASVHFPLATLAAKGSIEEVLMEASALEAEDIFKHNLKESRAKDAITGGAATGPHKSDLFVKYAAKNMSADQCSTGEQKALLIGIILAHAALIKAERGASPILLLDEVAAHLDEERRAALYDLLEDLGAQVWLTGTDANLFTAIEGKAQFFEVAEASVLKKQMRPAA
ncbi:MAG: DNA replication/repair protein RecF [Bdellovibrionales bacterium]